jgi:hypothetical protein
MRLYEIGSLSVASNNGIVRMCSQVSPKRERHILGVSSTSRTHQRPPADAYRVLLDLFILTQYSNYIHSWAEIYITIVTLGVTVATQLDKTTLIVIIALHVYF